MRKAKLAVKVLVTDHDVVVLGTDPDRDLVLEKIREVVSFGGATAVQIQTMEFEVDLLPPAPRVKIDTDVRLDIAPDVREMVEAQFERDRISHRERSWGTLLNALAPGVYRIHHNEFSREISFSKEEEGK